VCGRFGERRWLDNGSSCEVIVEDSFAIGFGNGFGCHREGIEVSLLLEFRQPIFDVWFSFANKFLGQIASFFCPDKSWKPRWTFAATGTIDSTTDFFSNNSEITNSREKEIQPGNNNVEFLSGTNNI